MRSQVAILLVLVVGCASREHATFTGSGPPYSSEWPFEAPAWVPASDEEEMLAEDETPLAMLECEFIAGATSVPQLADLLGLSSTAAVVLDEQRTTALKQVTRQLRETRVVNSPRILVRDAQAAWVSVVGQAGGRRLYVKCSDITANAGTVVFVAEQAMRDGRGGWDAPRTWRVEEQKTLRSGSAIVCLGSDADLVIVRLVKIVRH